MVYWVDVDSKRISKIAYNSELQTMYIDFQGSIIDTPFVGVPENEFDTFRQAQNIDEYYEKQIKDVYEKAQLDTDCVINI